MNTQTIALVMTEFALGLLIGIAITAIIKNREIKKLKEEQNGTHRQHQKERKKSMATKST